MQTSPPTTATKRLGAGAITGIIAGLIMAVVVMLVFWVVFGKSPLYPVQVIGATVYGEEGLQGFHIGAFVAGLVIHMAISIVWGLAFGVLAGVVTIKSVSKALIFGLILGVVSMIDVYYFVPMFFNALNRVDIWNREVPLFWDWAAHIVFGASFGFYPVVLARLK